MNKLLAPNGKDSNLTPEQHELVREPAFKSWFGDWEKLAFTKLNDSGIDEVSLKRLEDGVSKVVDENGEPLLLFHGSTSNHSIFEIPNKSGAMGRGIYLTTDVKMALFYGKNLYQLFANIRNPKYVNTRNEDTQMLGGSMIYLRKKGKGFYDGACNENVIWLAIEPTQIKLADGTNTTFDNENLDIRFEKGGNVNELNKDMNNQSNEIFAKGGKILIKQIDEKGAVKNVHQDHQKYSKINISDKYFIEASNDVGLQGVVFNEESLSKKIKEQFKKLTDSYTDYLISKDSEYITNYINNEISTHQENGSSLEVIQKWRDSLDDKDERLKIIQDIARTQKQSLDQWVEYLIQSEYPIHFKYLILKAVLNYNYDLKQDKLIERNEETIRNTTPFDAGSLAELFDRNSNYLLKDYNVIMNENSIKILNSREVIGETTDGKWIRFKGGRNATSSEISTNAKELMQLVQNTYWCTKNQGRNQLQGGDFYVYVTESRGEVFPRIAVRMNEDNIGEVRGNSSASQDLDAEMLPIAEEFLINNIPNNSGKRWLDSIKYNKRCVDIRKRFESEGLYENFIFEFIELVANKNKFKVDYGENGNVVLMLEKFNQAKEKLPNKYYKKGDIESDFRMLSPQTRYYIGHLHRYEIEILKNEYKIDVSDLSNWKLEVVSGNIDCSNIITNLGNIEYVGKDLILSSSVKEFGHIKFVGGIFDMGVSQISSLRNIEQIGSGFSINSNVKDLGKLKKVGWLKIFSCDEGFSLGELETIEGDFTIEALDKDIDFGKLKKIGGNFFAGKSLVTNLKELEFVGNNFNISGSKIKLFPNLKTIVGFADFSNNFCSSTQNIEHIFGGVKFLNSRIMEFPKLEKIGGEIEFRGSYFKSFGSIKTIGSNVNLAESKIEDLGKLEEVNGYISFKGSKVKSLNKLKKIVGFANFDNSDVEDLGDLESIGGNAYFNSTKIKSIGKLKYIGGFAQFTGSNELGKQWEKVSNEA